jgi:hypothetical protein
MAACETILPAPDAMVVDPENPRRCLRSREEHKAVTGFFPGQ